GDVDNTARKRVLLEGGAFAVMSAGDRELGLAGLKSYAWLENGTPFVVVLVDTEKAELAAVIEADKLGQLRTGAASGVAARYLAREGAASLGVIGCGWQARSQIACIREALPSIAAVVAYCRSEQRLREFCKETGADPGESHRDAAAQDVVVTATTSRDPVLRGEWLRAGALVCAIGANDPRHRELDNVVLERAALVCCDSLQQARLESGDLIEPVEAGVLDWLEVHELQEVVAGELPGRQRERERQRQRREWKQEDAERRRQEDAAWAQPEHRQASANEADRVGCEHSSPARRPAEVRFRNGWTEDVP